MSTAERLKQYLEYRKIPVFRAEKECGLSSSALSKAFPDKSIGSDNLEKILSTYTELSADWLLRGTGSMIIGESRAVELERKIASFSKSQEHREQAYDILLGMFEIMSKTYDFFGKKESDLLKN